VNKHWTDRYLQHNPCADGLDDARRYDTAQEWWDACEHGTWMEWVLDVGRAWPRGTEAEYGRTLDKAWSEYYRVGSAVAFAKYERITTAALRRLVPNMPYPHD